MMKGLAALRAKTYSYLTNSNDEDKKAIKKVKGTQKRVIKRKLIFEDYKIV